MPNSNRKDIELVPLYPIIYEDIIQRALLEDMGRGGDLTTNAVVSAKDTATASIVARVGGRIAGIEIACRAFHLLDPGLNIDFRICDGVDIDAGETLAIIQGAARPILSAERTCLNILARLSGIATTTQSIVAAIAPYQTRVVCTRKTTPGLRVLEKYAVRAGGGSNHRYGLDDAILIKDNHILVAGGIREAIQRARRNAGHMVKIEVEVDTLEQLELALKEDVDAVLLDNMSLEMLTQAVRMTNKRVLTEASGGITPQTAPPIAASGVDLISIGWLTHSAPSLNLSMELAVRL
jgi:nicotinate-nucleotide pyrophosphorylase (carboxylating)